MEAGLDKPDRDLHLGTFFSFGHHIFHRNGLTLAFSIQWLQSPVAANSSQLPALHVFVACFGDIFHGFVFLKLVV